MSEESIPTFTEQELESSIGSKRDESLAIREIIRNVLRTDAKTENEVRKYWSGGGHYTGQIQWDTHHAVLAVIEGDSSGYLQKIAAIPGGENHVYQQLRGVYKGVGYVIKGSQLRAARLEHKPEPEDKPEED